MKRRRQHGVPVIGALVLLAVIAAAVQIAEHLALLAVIVAVAAGRTTSGRHGRRRARTGTISPGPGQGQASEPAAAAALPVATLPLADYRDEPGAEQRSAGQADRDSLLADPRSGARPLWGPT